MNTSSDHTDRDHLPVPADQDSAGRHRSVIDLTTTNHSPANRPAQNLAAHYTDGETVAHPDVAGTPIRPARRQRTLALTGGELVVALMVTAVAVVAVVAVLAIFALTTIGT